jgi:hypothetical protein
MEEKITTIKKSKPRRTIRRSQTVPLYNTMHASPWRSSRRIETYENVLQRLMSSATPQKQLNKKSKSSKKFKMNAWQLQRHCLRGLQNSENEYVKEVTPPTHIDDL